MTQNIDEFLAPFLGAYQGAVDSVKPTPDNLEQMLNTMFDSIALSTKLPRNQRDRICIERNRWISLCRKASLTAQATDLDMALGGLKELGQVVWDSGIPQAALMFAVVYKLMDGIINAGAEAEQEYGIPRQQ